MSRAQWERTWAAREDQRRRKIEAMLGEILRTVAIEHITRVLAATEEP